MRMTDRRPTRRHAFTLAFLAAALLWSGASKSSLGDAKSFNGTLRPNGPALGLSAAGSTHGASRVRLANAYGRLPLGFEINRGQTDRRVDFLARGSGYALYLTSGEAVLTLHAPAADAAVRLKLVGGRARPGVGQDALPGTVNYFMGNDARRWRAGIPTYATVAYHDVYPGVDVIYYGNRGNLEYDFVVHPGADPTIITLRFEGQDSLEVDAQGDLVLQTRAGPIRLQKPHIYQDVDGERSAIEGGYERRSRNRVGFRVADYDVSRLLVIDPVLSYSTYLGGSGRDRPSGLAVDGAGNAYIAGLTRSADFPTTPGAFDTTMNGYNDPILGRDHDVFVMKLDPTGATLLYATYLGGSYTDEGRCIAVDASGAAYVAGETASSDFPKTPGAFDPTARQGVFVTKLDPTGAALVYSTSLGSGSYAGGIAVDGSGAAYVAGRTTARDFPITAGAFDRTFGGGDQDAFVTKLDPAGAALLYSTFLGGSDTELARDIALDASGAAYVAVETVSSDFPTTPDAFDRTWNGTPELRYSDAAVTKLDPAGAALVYSTYLGGIYTDRVFSIAVDASADAYVTGRTDSADFPTTPGAFDTIGRGLEAFVTKLNRTGTALVYSTYVGGSANEEGSGIAVDGSGAAYITGSTESADFPTTPGALDTTSNAMDAFVTKLNKAGAALVYSSYLGGSSWDGFDSISKLDIAVDGSGAAYVAGLTGSADFATTAGAFDTTFNGGLDAFVVKIQVNRRPVADAGGNLTVECAGAAGTEVTLDAEGSSDADADALSYAWTGPFGRVEGPRPTVTLPLGGSTITLVVNDGAMESDPDVIVVEVRDTLGPTLGVAAAPALLWPPDGRLVEVAFQVAASDRCDPSPAIVLLDVRSSDPEGAGRGGPSILGADLGMDDRLISLRADRTSRGLGKSYTVTYRAIDASGNAATAVALVQVPHTPVR